MKKEKLMLFSSLTLILCSCTMSSNKEEQHECTFLMFGDEARHTESKAYISGEIDAYTKTVTGESDAIDDINLLTSYEDTTIYDLYRNENGLMCKGEKHIIDTKNGITEEKDLSFNCKVLNLSGDYSDIYTTYFVISANAQTYDTSATIFYNDGIFGYDKTTKFYINPLEMKMHFFYYYYESYGTRHYFLTDSLENGYKEIAELDFDKYFDFQVAEINRDIKFNEYGNVIDLLVEGKYYNGNSDNAGKDAKITDFDYLICTRKAKYNY